MGHPGPFYVAFRSLQTICRIKTVDFSGIRTKTIRVESEHADHLTTTMAHFFVSKSGCIVTLTKRRRENMSFYLTLSWWKIGINKLPLFVTVLFLIIFPIWKREKVYRIDAESVLDSLLKMFYFHFQHTFINNTNLHISLTNNSINKCFSSSFLTPSSLKVFSWA